MVQRTPVATAALYETDETAWLETTAELIRHGQLDAVDLDSLAEYLTDMAKRDRREVFSRLVVLLSHLLKWEHQPDRGSGSWEGTILEQQRELRQLLESGTGRGLLIGGNDMLIAAIAMARGCTLVTHNTAEFRWVAGLVIEDWQFP